MMHFNLKKTCVFLILMLLFSCLLSGQTDSEIDSLKLELSKQQSDTAKIRLLLTLAKKYSRNDSDTAFSYISQAKKTYRNVNDQKIFAEILMYEGLIYSFSDSSLKSIAKYKQAISIFKKYAVRSKIADCYLGIGSVYADLEKNTETISSISRAMELYQLLHDNNGLAKCYIAIATVYFKQKNYKKAIEYQQKAVLMTNKDNKYELAQNYMNLFSYYAFTKEFNKALSLVDSIFPALKEANDIILLGRAYNNLGALYMDMKNYSKAKECILKGLNLSLKSGNTHEVLYRYIVLADLYNKNNQTDSAIAFLNKALDMNKTIHNLGSYERIYYDLYAIYEKKGDTKLALEYYIEFIAVSDSINEDLNSKALMELQTKYDVDLKNEQIKVLAKNEQLAKQKIIILLISLLVIIISASFFIFYRYRKAKEKKLIYEAELKEKEYKHQAELKVAAYQIELKKRELTYKAIDIAQKEQILATIREQLENLKAEKSRSKETILDLLSGINLQLRQNSFEDFEKYFIEVHPEFYSKLKQNFSELTQNDLKVCALIKLNLSIKQIADITGKTPRSIENTRYTIRKKMGLSIEENLFETISQF